MDLPSYKPSFLFLLSVPLEVIHEFLLMRLEQKPVNPSPLSIRQLMRELKEGLKIATIERARFVGYIDTIMMTENECREVFQRSLDAFDDSLLKVFSDYLDYFEQWALLQHDSFQKSLLEEEWNFSCEIVPNVAGAAKLLAAKFSSILAQMLHSVGERLIERIAELYNGFKNEVEGQDDTTFK